MFVHLNLNFQNTRNKPNVKSSAEIKFNQAKKSAGDFIAELSFISAELSISSGPSWGNDLKILEGSALVDPFWSSPLRITNVFWTNTKERFEGIWGYDDENNLIMPHNGNPSDVVVEVTDDATDTRYLGVSLKATNEKK